MKAKSMTPKAPFLLQYKCYWHQLSCLSAIKTEMILRSLLYRFHEKLLTSQSVSSFDIFKQHFSEFILKTRVSLGFLPTLKMSASRKKAKINFLRAWEVLKTNQISIRSRFFSSVSL